jgi:hypothetical protein
MEFARQLALLMDDAPRRQAMGQQGLEQVATRLAWSHQLKNLLAVYASLETERLGTDKRAAQHVVGVAEARSDEEGTLHAGQDPT